MKYRVLFILFISFLISGCSYYSYNDVLTLCEKSYFEGQKDAIYGDIRIENINGYWHWIKSPWDNGRVPNFNPAIIKEEVPDVSKD